MADQTLDAKGLNCPLPILKTKKMLTQVPAGGTLEVLATDPGSVADMASFCRTTGNELLEFDEGRGRFPLSHQAHRLTMRRPAMGAAVFQKLGDFRNQKIDVSGDGPRSDGALF